jgi:hypothetical protein
MVVVVEGGVVVDFEEDFQEDFQGDFQGEFQGEGCHHQE